MHAPGTAADSSDGEGPRLSVRLGAGAAVAGVFLVLRMLAVAHWDWHSVATIADTFDFSDAFPIAFGTVAGQPVLTGVFVALLLPPVAMRCLWPAERHRGTVSVDLILSAVLLVTIAISMTVTFDNPWTLVGAAVFGLLITTARLWWRRTGVIADLVVSLTRRLGMIAAGAVLILAAVNDAPWVSEERIHTDHGVIDGYVLEAEPGFLHVLTENRDVIIIPDSTVSEREIAD